MKENDRREALKRFLSRNIKLFMANSGLYLAGFAEKGRISSSLRH
jgi:hypothetical protein